MADSIGASTADQIWEEEQKTRASGQKPWWQRFADAASGWMAQHTPPDLEQRLLEARPPETGYNRFMQSPMSSLLGVPAGRVEVPGSGAFSTLTGQESPAQPLADWMTESASEVSQPSGMAMAIPLPRAQRPIPKATGLPEGVPRSIDVQKYESSKRPMEFRKSGQSSPDMDLYWGTVKSPTTSTVKSRGGWNIDSSVMDESGKIINPAYIHLEDHPISKRIPGRVRGRAAAKGVVSKSGEDIYRGMNGEELVTSLQRGHFKHEGPYDRSRPGDPPGLTYGSSYPDAATLRAKGPLENPEPTFDEPSYVVQFSRSNVRVRTPAKFVPPEPDIGMIGEIPISAVRKIYEIRLAAEMPGTRSFAHVKTAPEGIFNVANFPRRDVRQRLVVREVPAEEWMAHVSSRSR